MPCSSRFDRFKHNLVSHRAMIEDDGSAFAPRQRGLQDAVRSVAGELKWRRCVWPLLVRTSAPLLTIMVRGESICWATGSAESVLAAGDTGDFDAAADGFGDGGAVAVRDGEAGVEKGAVDVEGDELDGHVSILA